MYSSDQTARDIIGHLAYQIAKGWEAFLVAKCVHEQRKVKRINCVVYFFNAVEESSMEVAILALSRLLITQDDSITIQYLLNYAEQNSSSFPHVERNTVSGYVVQHRGQLKSIAALIDNIKEQRDQTLAHLDKLHIKNPSALYTHPPLNYQEVEDAFLLLLGMINVYAGYLTPSDDIRLDNIDSGVVDDVEYLARLIEADNART